MGTWRGVRTMTEGGEVQVHHVEPTATPATPAQTKYLRDLYAQLGEPYVAPLSKASASKMIRKLKARLAKEAR